MKRHHQNLTCLSWLLVLLINGSVLAQDDARIVEWVEDAPVSDNTRIALGYPVPIPVNTPLPFDGFRSYSGLHARHQDLAATTPWVHASEIGTTQQGRTVWLYRLGDENLQTARGLPEQAMLTNGGIHAREWQSPEVATGIIERIALSPDDHHLVSYLRENANVMVIPVFNIDGFLQTQRYPDSNWLGTDPDDPAESPRDGRMRKRIRPRHPRANRLAKSGTNHRVGVAHDAARAPILFTPEKYAFAAGQVIGHARTGLRCRGALRQAVAGFCPLP